ncbi:flavonol sulfotransferase-like [Triticum dicoccoides]|uniref:flavonol sulfotransferase-like n=1 Tax=Triticum dicoccoides TaxID=85692 RepID=UPI00188E12BA|nr:flavonol sulfotransferase-like [Triticum dicoccoides]
MNAALTVAVAGEEIDEAVAGEEIDEAASRAQADMSEIMSSLPRCPVYLTRHYRGFWIREFVLKGMAAAQASFEPRPTDVFLASCPKSGTTWLKALAFATLNRATHLPSDSNHPLCHRNPHDCVAFLETRPVPETMALPSPRLLATHIPCSLLPSRITECGRVVYVCREPKDALVSFWIYNNKIAPMLRRKFGLESPSPTFEEAFELFCEGQSSSGPPWRHALEYWEESRRRPGKVLFLRYEDMLQDPTGNAKNLAAFMGCPFSCAEEEAGVVQEIVQLCSFEKLKSSEVNKNGSSAMMGVNNDVYFRKGAVGDWKNYMTPEMAARLDKIVEEALQGSGLTFGISM